MTGQLRSLNTSLLMFLLLSACGGLDKKLLEKDLIAAYDKPLTTTIPITGLTLDSLSRIEPGEDLVVIHYEGVEQRAIISYGEFVGFVPDTSDTMVMKRATCPTKLYLKRDRGAHAPSDSLLTMRLAFGDRIGQNSVPIWRVDAVMREDDLKEYRKKMAWWVIVLLVLLYIALGIFVLFFAAMAAYAKNMEQGT